MRAEVSQAFASQPNPAGGFSSEGYSAQPADITRRLEKSRAPSVSDLKDIHNYDDQSVS